eukprot:1612983-Rhodomonas_salina.4
MSGNWALPRNTAAIVVPVREGASCRLSGHSGVHALCALAANSNVHGDREASIMPEKMLSASFWYRSMI